MSIWRRLIATGFLLLALSLLAVVGHGPDTAGGGEAAHVAVEAGHDHPCTAGPACAPFVVALEAEVWGLDAPSAPANLRRGVAEPYLAPYLPADTPPPRRPA